jgi:hypothetical protein
MVADIALVLPNAVNVYFLTLYPTDHAFVIVTLAFLPHPDAKQTAQVDTTTTLLLTAA